MTRTQCSGCPWRHMDDPELPFTPKVIEAAASGEVFVCHERMGPCPGPIYAGVVSSSHEDNE